MSNFRSLGYDGSDAQKLECLVCKTQFFVCPCGEENLIWDATKQCLVPICPTCGTVDL